MNKLFGINMTIKTSRTYILYCLPAKSNHREESLTPDKILYSGIEYGCVVTLMLLSYIQHIYFEVHPLVLVNIKRITKDKKDSHGHDTGYDGRKF